MARRRRRRARARRVVMVNPRGRHVRRRRRNPGRAMVVRHYRRRRRNPGGMSGALRFVLKTAIPSILGAGLAGYAEAKWLGDKSAIVQVGGKIGLAALAGAVLRKRPIAAAAAMGGILGTIGFAGGVSAAGGVIAASPTDLKQQLRLLVREDPRAMGLLVTDVRQQMGAPRLDDRVSLSGNEIASTALPGAVYDDVNLG